VSNGRDSAQETPLLPTPQRTSPIYALAWAYDAVGNRTYESRNSAQSYFRYDVANQLTDRHELTGDAWTYLCYDALIGRGQRTYRCDSA